MDDVTYDLGGEEPIAKPGRPGLPLEPRRVLGILAEHQKPLLRAFLIASAVSFIAFFFLPREYESWAQLLYEGTPILDPEEKEPNPDAFVDAAIAPSRLREARERLGWDLSLEELESHVEVQLEGKAAMRIVGQAGTAEEAHSLTRAVLDVFLERQASFNAKRLERLTSETQLALKHAKKRREDAYAAYEAFREKSGMPDLIREQDQLLARKAELRSQVEEASVEVAAQTARIVELEKAQRELPTQIVASARKGSPIDVPLAEARAQLAAARASLSERHPTVLALREQVASLQAQRKGQTSELAEQTLGANPARVAVDQQLADARAALAAAKERESVLRTLLDTIKKEAASLGPEEGEARQVIGELELAEERVEELTERGSMLRDAALGQLTGFRVLSAPTVPEDSERSGLHILLLVMLPIVTVLVVALVFLARRLRTLTVEAPREVAWWGNGPVLGTSVWPRDPAALESFVDELEDHGMYGAGRTLVVPATEAEREIACSFATRLAGAPWLAAAILDVGERAVRDSYAPLPLATPPPRRPRRLTPHSLALSRRFSSHASSSVPPGRVTPAPRPPSRPTIQGFAPPTGSSTPPPVVTPAPRSDETAPPSSRPPRKKTMIGLPAVRSSEPTPVLTAPVAGETGPPSTSTEPTPQPAEPAPFRRNHGARASVRMIIPVTDGNGGAATEGDSDAEGEAFLLTRAVPVANEPIPPRVGRAVHVATESPKATASNAVMRAAVKLLGDDDDDITALRRSRPPLSHKPGDVTGVALAWNGPLSGPVLRRAARLAHRVMVVVSSGMNVIDLARVQTRLGREKGVGYVLVNVNDAYVDLQDRVGPVEEFWMGARDTDDTGRGLR